MMTVRAKFCGADSWLAASWTMTVMGNVPVAVAVPERTPAGLSPKVEGSAPDSVQVNGASPPVAVKEKL